MLWVNISVATVAIATFVVQVIQRYTSLHRIYSLQDNLADADKRLVIYEADNRSLQMRVDELTSEIAKRDERIKFMTLELNERKEIICKIQEALL